MANGKSFLIDLSRCTGCRGCQVACKQWKKLPAEETRNWGSHQNPADFTANTYKLVRMKDATLNGGPAMFLLPDQCRHCVGAPCKLAGDMDVPGAVIQDPNTGAVIFTEKASQLDINRIRPVCPYDVPRYNKVTKTLTKCDMCSDRVAAGWLPACVKTCPTGAMNFGDRDEMLEMGKTRLKALKSRRPQAQLVDAEEVRVIFLTEHAPYHYHKYLSASESAPVRKAEAKGMTRETLLSGLLNPIRELTKNS